MKEGDYRFLVGRMFRVHVWGDTYINRRCLRVSVEAGNLMLGFELRRFITFDIAASQCRLFDDLGELQA